MRVLNIVTGLDRVNEEKLLPVAKGRITRWLRI